MISSPILHDVIKAHLVYDYRNIYSFCSTLPQLKRSHIFTNSCHYLVDAKQEWFVGGTRYPADAVWRFGAEGFPFPSYYIVHEVKTGGYDLQTEMQKHYIKHNHVSFYVWAHRLVHKTNKKPYGAYVKQLDVDALKKYITGSTIRLMEKWRTINVNRH